MKITYIESPEGLLHEGTKWEELKQQIISEKPEVLVTNEMPFGSWLAVENEFNTADAEASISAHDYGVDALKKLNIPLVLSSRPVPIDDKLANEAFALVNGEYRFAHQSITSPKNRVFMRRLGSVLDEQASM